ncbi:SagB/ThcOx family dehydrogenase, partial [Streptomyces sp. SID7804]|nr:SagB/ThcOx family dehydrogenase [Streptomyces sp. SID7804]
HLAHLTARRHGLTARPVGSWQQADLGAALGAPPGRDWVVHGLALGTRHADEENTT